MKLCTLFNFEAFYLQTSLSWNDKGLRAGLLLVTNVEWLMVTLEHFLKKCGSVPFNFSLETGGAVMLNVAMVMSVAKVTNVA